MLDALDLAGFLFLLLLLDINILLLLSLDIIPVNSWYIIFTTTSRNPNDNILGFHILRTIFNLIYQISI